MLTGQNTASGGRYMGKHSQRILAQAGLIGVSSQRRFFAAKIPQSSLPAAKFAANVVPCSTPLTCDLSTGGAAHIRALTHMRRPGYDPSHAKKNDLVSKYHAPQGYHFGWVVLQGDTPGSVHITRARGVKIPSFFQSPIHLSTKRTFLVVIDMPSLG